MTQAAKPCLHKKRVAQNLCFGALETTRIIESDARFRDGIILVQAIRNVTADKAAQKILQSVLLHVRCQWLIEVFSRFNQNCSVEILTLLPEYVISTACFQIYSTLAMRIKYSKVIGSYHDDNHDCRKSINFQVAKLSAAGP